MSLFTRHGMSLHSGDREYSPGNSEGEEMQECGRLRRIAVGTPHCRVKKQEEDSWLPRTREGYEAESLGFFSVIISHKMGRKLSNN